MELAQALRILQNDYSSNFIEITPSDSAMNSTDISTHRASLAVGDEASARRLVDLLTEILIEDEAAVAAYEGPGGRWDVMAHFAEAPDQVLLRAQVANAAGKAIADSIVFDT